MKIHMHGYGSEKPDPVHDRIAHGKVAGEMFGDFCLFFFPLL